MWEIFPATKLKKPENPYGYWLPSSQTNTLLISLINFPHFPHFPQFQNYHN